MIAAPEAAVRTGSLACHHSSQPTNDDHVFSTHQPPIPRDAACGLVEAATTPSERRQQEAAEQAINGRVSVPYTQSSLQPLMPTSRGRLSLCTI